MGFQKTKADPCAYVKRDSAGVIFLTVHVDDMLLASPSPTVRSWFENQVKKWFEISMQVNSLTYLGMSVTKDETGISVHQVGYIETLGLKFGIPSDIKASCPTSADLFKSERQGKAMDKSKYLSLVMSLMYLARFTRPDILMPTTFLATKSAAPTEENYDQLMQILGYVMATRLKRLLFSSSADLTLAIYADAAHMIHSDSKGHGGILVTLGSAPIVSKSFKLKLVTRSSTESELLVLDEAVTYSLWLTSLLRDLIPTARPPVTIFQDNKSTMALVMSGGSFNRSKHIINKYAFVKQHLDLGDIKLEYCPTESMLADMLTKPLEGYLLKKMAKLIWLVDPP
jgi:hypothetical protein